MSLRNILIIDTDEVFIGKLQEFFQSKEINNITVVPTVQDGLQRSKKALPDIILVDMMTNDVNGLDAIEVFSKLDNSMRILVTTDNYSDEYCDLAFEAGADAFIDKNNFKEDVLTILNAVPKHILFLFEKYLISKN